MEQDRKSGDLPVISAASDYSTSPGEILSVRNITFVVFRIFCIQGVNTE